MFSYIKEFYNIGEASHTSLSKVLSTFSDFCSFTKCSRSVRTSEIDYAYILNSKYSYSVFKDMLNKESVVVYICRSVHEAMQNN